MKILIIYFHSGVRGIRPNLICYNCEGEIRDDDYIEIRVSSFSDSLTFNYHLRCVDVGGAKDVLNRIPT